MSTLDERRFAAAQQFQQYLGREATPEELDFAVSSMADDAISPAEFGQILQSHPEYQAARLNKDTAAYGQTLNAQNADILNQAGAAAQSRFAGLGRPNSSALGASVMQAGGQLAQQRQSALASFYGQGLQNNASMQARQGMNVQDRAYGIKDDARRRGYEIEDYYRQKNDYESARQGQSGWNAITPEFVASGLFSMGGKAAAAYTGGLAGNTDAKATRNGQAVR